MRKNKRVVLVPYNFKKRAERALENAIHIAHYLQADIHLLSIIQSGDFFTELFRSQKDLRNAMRETKEELLKVGQKVTDETGIKVECSVEAGNMEEIILEMANHLNAAYIVMGKILAETSRMFFVSAQYIPIIAKASCPVIMTGEQTIKDEGFKNIVLPLDLSKQTLEKVQKAILWARYYKATIHLVGVLSGGVPPVQSRLHKQMERAKRMVELAGLPYTSEIYKMSDMPIHVQILLHTQKVGGDLLMIMTHQEKCETDTYIGKVAQNLIRYAEVPVVSFTSAAMCHRNHLIVSFTPIKFLAYKAENHQK